MLIFNYATVFSNFLRGAHERLPFLVINFDNVLLEWILWNKTQNFIDDRITECHSMTLNDTAVQGISQQCVRASFGRPIWFLDAL